MAKRSADAESEGPSAKMRRDDSDEAGGGRTGRVRKKSAKVLEMEEFEQVEKTHQAGKKSKTPKGGPEDPSVEVPAPATTPKLKAKAPKVPAVTPKSALATNLMQAPIAVAPAPAKSTKSGSAVKGGQPTKPVLQFVPVRSSGILPTSVKPVETATDMLASVIKKELHEEVDEESEDSVPVAVAGKSDQPQSVIKYLLSSPSSGSKTPVGSSESGAELVGGAGKKTSSKKSKPVQEKASSSGKAVKSKAAKQKLNMKEEEDAEDDSETHAATASLKMRISASSDPQSAQVTLNPSSETPAAPEKPKKSSKKLKTESPDPASAVKTESNVKGSPSKKSGKKVFKQKEKLIQDVISAVSKQSNLTTLTVPPGLEAGKLIKKKKKIKVEDGTSLGEMNQSDLYIDCTGEESTLVIAETEKKKKKTLKKKKSPLKDKGLSMEGKTEDEKPDKKLSKRAPTAYMLFCNTHRPGIVNCHPGIEFAGISRKLGEMWQTLSTKQKLQWRRKAQRRMKRGSNLISTGKAAKDAAPQVSTLPLAHPSSGSAQGSSGNAALVRYINMANRSPVETPQSPTKLNFSFEPVDVAAHLKLLGESLSIIGMRLQEHKGMIAVQGSLSVLLDSLLCACGPLLCLTQQVPDMDGCDPIVHGQTLDSVAYVMPGL